MVNVTLIISSHVLRYAEGSHTHYGVKQTLISKISQAASKDINLNQCPIPFKSDHAFSQDKHPGRQEANGK
jgi:hypothetical protein